MRSNRFLAAILAVVLLLSAVPFLAQAQEQSPTENHNIVIMVDSGGSLKQGITSDPNKYRFSAIGMFFDLLGNVGDHICVVDFKGNNKQNDSSDQAMRELIRCYPESGLKEITSRDDKKNMKDFITREAGGYTDIGTALLVAAEQLDGKTKENGLDSYIFLFTDGKTEFRDGAPQAYYDKSRENQEKALEMIRENGIILCAVYLDNNGEQNGREVADLVRASLTDNADEQAGITDEDLKAMYRYDRVTSAANLSGVFQNFFMRLSSATKREMAPSDTFIVPGSGIREINLCITTESNQDTVNHTKISSLVNSNRGPLSGEYLLDCRSYGESYVIYKLVDPEPGEYHIEWTSPDPGAKCQIIMDTDFTAELNLDTVPEKIRYNKPFNIDGCLYDRGEKLTKSSDYSGFTCVLEIYEQNTDQPVHRQEIFQNNKGLFSAAYTPATYGAYTAQLVFVCGDLRINSNRVEFNIDNYPPDVTNDTKRISTSFGGDGVRVLDLSEYISDPEDTELTKLKITPNVTNTYPESAFEIAGDNSTLTIRGREGGSGTLELFVEDTQGRNAVWILEIKVRDNTAVILLVLLLLAAVLTVSFFKVKYQLQKAVNVCGKLKIQLNLGGKPCRIELDAMECLNKDLYEILHCRRNYLIHHFSENADFRANADLEIDGFLRRNQAPLESRRLIAYPRLGGSCELRIVDYEAAVKPGQEDAKAFLKQYIQGEPLKEKENKKIRFSGQDSCSILYQK